MSDENIKIEGAFYFEHPYDLPDNLKLIAAYEKAGFEAYGIYILLISKICREGGKLEEKNISSLIYAYRIDESLFTSCFDALKEVGLIKVEKGFVSAPLATMNLENRKQNIAKKISAGKASVEARRARTIQKQIPIDQITDEYRAEMIKKITNDAWINNICENEKWKTDDFRKFAGNFFLLKPEKTLTYPLDKIKEYIIEDYKQSIDSNDIKKK